MSGDQSGPGWYRDPWDVSRWRWWDGTAWTDQSHVGVPPGIGAPWASSRLGTSVGRVVEAAAGPAAVVAAVVALVDIVMRRPVPGVVLLLLPAIPLLVVGQVLSIAVLYGRSHPNGPVDPAAQDMPMWDRGRRLFFAGLPARWGWSLQAVFMLAWLSGTTAMADLRLGNPTDPVPGCPYPLSSHGIVTCVSQGAYQVIEASEQRIVASALLAFFVIHFGVARSARLSTR